MVDLTGRVIVVTGASSGIGRQTAQALAASGATVVAVSRNRPKLDAAVADVRTATGSYDVHAVEIDLSEMAEVRRGAERILGGWDRVDVLVNNAGVALSDRRQSSDGFEMTFATNHLGPFLLTTLLLDRLKACAPARIVNVSSMGHRLVNSVGFDDLQSERSYSGLKVYARSKLANILFTQELDRRLAGSGITAFAVHPGTVRSGFTRDGDVRGLIELAMRTFRPLLISPESGSAAVIHVAAAAGLEALSGGYFQRAVAGNYGPVRQVRPSRAGRDPQAARHLWEISEKLLADWTFGIS